MNDPLIDAVYGDVFEILSSILSKFPADLVTFTEEILNGKLHFLCNAFAKIVRG